MQQPLRRTRIALLAAADAPRLQLLLHASSNGHVAPRDARRYAVLSPRSGTGQYHVQTLVTAGLLERQKHGMYTLTNAGLMIVRLHGLLQQPFPVRRDGLEIDVWTDSSALEALFPQGDDYCLELTARLPQGSRGIRISRNPRP